MKFPLSKIRAVFPEWPSEVDIAQQAENWAAMAQAYYCAADVLQNESRKAHEKMHAGESQVSEHDLKRIQTSSPALFCMSLALELAAKAAIVNETQGADIKGGERLPFAGHKVDKLCGQLPELKLSCEEQECLRQAAEIITNGKYPTRLRPSAEETFDTPPNLDDFMNTALPVYKKLMDLVSNA